mgnify:FL=1
MRKIFIVISLLFLACQNEKAPKIFSVDNTVEAIDKNVSKQATKLSIDGMMCAIGCAATIEKNLSKTAGVVSAQINFESKTGWVIYDTTSGVNPQSLIAIVEKSGDGKTYKVSASSSINLLKVPLKN